MSDFETAWRESDPDYRGRTEDGRRSVLQYDEQGEGTFLWVESSLAAPAVTSIIHRQVRLKAALRRHYRRGTKVERDE